MASDDETRGAAAPETRARTPRAATAIAITIVLLASFAAGRTLLAPGFYDAHDNLMNLYRVHQLEKCVADGQIPCRWVPDMGAGYGYPLFNYYPSLPSAVAVALRSLGLSHLDAVKATLWLSIVGAGLAMFALARPLLGDPGAVVAAVFYTWAPYRAIDVFVRGAMAEALALALLPLAFLGALHLLRDGHPARFGLLTALVWAALLQTHHGVCLMAAPAYAAWCALFIARRPQAGRFGWFAAAHVLAFGLASWFVLPAVFEREYVHIDALTTLYAWSHYEANFMQASQVLFGSLPWGYGAFRAEGGMSLFVGVASWAVATAAGIAAAVLWRRERVATDVALAVFVLLATGWIATGATLTVSKPVWDALPPLAFLQFPWRFLGIAALGFAFAAGFAASAVARWRWASVALCALLILAAIAPAWSWFRPSAMHRVEDEALVDERPIRAARHGAYDFLPRAVDLNHFVSRRAAAGRAPAPAELVDGRGAVVGTEQGTDWLTATVRVDEPSVLRINRFSFPDWVIEVDGAATVPVDHGDPIGRIHIAVAPGLRSVEARLEDTALRRLANRISLASLVIFAVLGMLACIPTGRSPLRPPLPSRSG